MCLSIHVTCKMDIFRWSKKQAVESSLDTQGGDPSISAPNPGTWSEMPDLRPVKTESSKPGRLSRLKYRLRSKVVEAPEPFETHPTVPVIPDVQVPHHPLVHLQQQKRSMNRERALIDHPVSGGRDVVASSSRQGRKLSSIAPEDNNDNPDNDAGNGTGSPLTSSLEKTASETPVRRKEETDHRDHRPPSSSQSPPLASTARMRRHSAQSTSTITEPTPITATFSSKHTSMTSATSTGAPASIPPLLAEEEATPPPLPKIPAAHSSSTRRDHSTERPKSARSARRQPHGTVGLQELVPSYDELWGA
jgi:hypothetical protein